MADTDNVHAATVKLPSFWSNNPTLWFAQAECQFGIKNITKDETKFWYIVSSLNADDAKCCMDIIRNPPAADKYTTIKACLMRNFTLTEYQRAEAILSLPSISDQTPSDLLNNMAALLPVDVHIDSNNFLLKYAFLSRLPPQVRSGLANEESKSLKVLAAKADKIFELQKQTQLSASVSTASPFDTTPDDTALASRRLCFYHSKFKNKAKKCAAPCDWQPTGNGRQDIA